MNLAEGFDVDALPERLDRALFDEQEYVLVGEFAHESIRVMGLGSTPGDESRPHNPP